MVTFAVIFLSFAALLLFYLLFRSLFVLFAERELRKCRNVRFSTSGVEIFAYGESLEYCIRAAILLGEKTTVFVAESDEESAYIAEAMQKYYDFEIIYTS
jgi:hypothetical protein